MKRDTLMLMMMLWCLILYMFNHHIIINMLCLKGWWSLCSVLAYTIYMLYFSIGKQSISNGSWSPSKLSISTRLFHALCARAIFYLLTKHPTETGDT